MKKLLSALALGLLGLGCAARPSLIFAEPQAQGVIGPFRGLHNSDNSLLIDDNEAQDVSNVDITDSGNGFKKRGGTAIFKTIGTSTWPVRGGYYFRDASGGDNIIHANNTSVFKSASGGNYSAFITTDTAGSYYDFTDSQGKLWRANNNRNEIFSYDGSAVTYYPSHPKGDQIEVLPSRLVISGVSGTPNAIDFSKAADFTDFAVGINEEDPYTETIALPGQKINAIKVACGESVLAWTRDTMSQYTGSNQFDGNIQQISNTIGTLQPNSVIQDYGTTYWQAQDGHFYAYDCSGVGRISQKLDVSGFAGGESKLWIQTEQSDWQAGTLTANLSATISAGDVVLSTWTDTDTSTADFTAGTTSGTYISSNSVYPSTATDTDTATADFTAGTFSGTFPSNNRVYLSTTSANIDNHSFESGTGTDPDNFLGSREDLSASFGAKDGSWAGNATSSHIPVRIYFSILDSAGVFISTAATYEYSTDFTNGAWVQKTVNLSSYIGRQIKIQFAELDASPGATSPQLISDTFLCSGGNMTFWAYKNETVPPPSFVGDIYVDLFEGGRSSVYSGTFTSATFDTAFTSGTWLNSSVNWTTNGHAISAQTQSSTDGSSWQTAVAWSTGTAPVSDARRYLRYVLTLSTGGTTNGTALPYVDDATLSAWALPAKFTSTAFNTALSSPAWSPSNAGWVTNSHAVMMETQSSTDGNTWDTAVAWSTGSAPSSQFKPYIRYIATLSTGSLSTGATLPHLDDVTLSARQSTGTFTSQTKNIGSNATAFRNFTASDEADGGTIGYFIRTATTEGGLSAASWVALVNDAQISASLNPWIQVKSTFTITAGSQDPTLSNFIVNWDEGTIVRVFGSVDNDHRLLWSVAEGTATVPNATYIYDVRFDSWLKYSIPFDAPARVGNSIYYGGVSTGVVYNWPSGETDSESAYTAYWKSKDFIGSSPFLEKDYVRYGFLAKAVPGSNIDFTYTVNTSSAVTNNYSLTDPFSVDNRRINANLPSGKYGTFINFRIGNDDANAPFEFYGFQYEYNPRPWKVLQ